MSRRWLILALGGAALGLLGADEAAPQAPRLVSPLPFSHPVHAEAFQVAKLGCVDCHALGAPLAEGAADAISAPLALCHGCHLQEADGARRSAPRSCALCHPAMDELLPASHGLGWRVEHGAEARAPGSGCRDCHEAAGCVDCHEDRGAGARSPHGPAFGSTHGVEAAVDPASCARCHAPTTCTSCHQDGGLAL